MPEKITQYDIESFEYRAEQQWKEGEEHPKLLFKYKGISTINQLMWLVDGLTEKYLYFPEVRELNDSLEGRGTRIFLSDSTVFEVKEAEKYKVLSFSKTCFSPVMWSHYGDNRKGVCLGFYKGNPYCQDNQSAFKEAEKVTYSNKDLGFSVDVKMAVKGNLLHKQKEWEYEQEWRIIEDPIPENEIDDKMKQKFPYEEEDLACIIFGEKTESIIKELLCSRFPSIRFYEVHHDAENYRYVLKRYDKGDKDFAINSVEELINDLQGE